MVVQIYETQSFEEAKKLCEMGVDHVGVLVGNGEYPREFSPEQAIDILSGVSLPAKKVVMSLSKDLDYISEIVTKTKPDILHLGTTPESLSPTDAKILKDKFPQLKIMRSLPVIDESSIDLTKQYDGFVDYILLDSHKKGDTQVGATGETHDWTISKKIVESVKTPIILAGGLGPDNVSEAIEKVKPFGVDSKTRTDRTDVRAKDLEKVKEFVKNAKSL